MLQQEVRKLKYKRNKKHQTIWNYIRRNPHFRVGELLMICDISLEYFKKYIRELEAAEYIVLTSKQRPYSNREYSLLENTGAAAPRVVPEGLYDANTKSTRILRPEKVQPEILKIIDAAKSLTMATQAEIAEFTEMTQKQIKDKWYLMDRLGLLLNKIKTELGDLYLFDLDRAREIIREYKRGIYTDEELRELWIKP